MSCFMLILTWLRLGIIFVKILHLAIARKISTNTMPPHVKMSILHDIGELFLNGFREPSKLFSATNFWTFLTF